MGRAGKGERKKERKQAGKGELGALGDLNNFDRARYKGVLRALLARRPRRRRGTIDKSAIYPHTSK